jgi:hypothetical protein
VTPAGNTHPAAPSPTPAPTDSAAKKEEQARRIAQTDRLFRALTFAVLAIFHFVAVLAWLGPTSYLRDSILRGTRRYVRTLKADQAWPMFAPDPLAYNRRIVILANLTNGETREVDLTTPLNRKMRSFNLDRIGKRLKAHDRVISGGERQYERGFLIHTCAELAAEWKQPIRDVVMYRDYSVIELEAHTYRTKVGPSQRVSVTTQVCPTEP